MRTLEGRLAIGKSERTIIISGIMVWICVGGLLGENM